MPSFFALIVSCSIGKKTDFGRARRGKNPAFSWAKADIDDTTNGTCHRVITAGAQT